MLGVFLNVLTLVNVLFSNYGQYDCERLLNVMIAQCTTRGHKGDASEKFLLVLVKHGEGEGGAIFYKMVGQCGEGLLACQP